jgi:hypothetical protein
MVGHDVLDVSGHEMLTQLRAAQADVSYRKIGVLSSCCDDRGRAPPSPAPARGERGRADAAQGREQRMGSSGPSCSSDQREFPTILQPVNREARIRGEQAPPAGFGLSLRDGTPRVHAEFAAYVSYPHHVLRVAPSSSSD